LGSLRLCGLLELSWYELDRLAFGCVCVYWELSQAVLGSRWGGGFLPLICFSFYFDACLLVLLSISIVRCLLVGVLQVIYEDVLPLLLVLKCSGWIVCLSVFRLPSLVETPSGYLIYADSPSGRATWHKTELNPPSYILSARYLSANHLPPLSMLPTTPPTTLG